LFVTVPLVTKLLAVVTRELLADAGILRMDKHFTGR
jgi:hypothetical protein